MTKTSFTPTPNQTAVLKALADAPLNAQEVARSKGVTVGATSVYTSLRSLKDRNLVLEKRVKAGSTPKGDRYEYRLSAKGRKLIEA